jgi:hypothetical protein
LRKNVINVVNVLLLLLLLQNCAVIKTVFYPNKFELKIASFVDCFWAINDFIVDFLWFVLKMNSACLKCVDK